MGQKVGQARSPRLKGAAHRSPLQWGPAGSSTFTRRWSHSAAVHTDCADLAIDFLARILEICGELPSAIGEHITARQEPRPRP